MTSSAPTTSGRSTVRSVERALDVLQALERSESPLRLAEIARATDLHPATALRIISVLQDRGMVVGENQLYRLGLGALALAHGFLASDPVSRSALPVMQQVSARTGLTVSLYAMIDFDRILIARVDGSDPLRYQIPIGRRLPLHVGAGKVIAASLPPAVLNEVLAEHDGYTRADGQHVTRAELDAQLDRARTEGHFVHIGDRDLGVGAISVPVRNTDRQVVASLSAAGPAETVDKQSLLAILPELERASTSIGSSF